MGNAAGDSIYGTDKVGSGIIDGVNLVGSFKEDLSGPGRSGMTGYAYASPSASVDLTQTTHYTATVINVSSSMSDADLKKINMTLMFFHWLLILMITTFWKFLLPQLV